MLVKALRLRHLGHRIPVDVLRQAVPLVGELTYQDHPHKQSSLSCLLMPLGGHPEPLAQLFYCRMKIEKRGLLIRGTEDIWHRKRRDSYPQTIWAWPVPPQPVTIRVTQPPYVMTELREAMR